MSLQATESSGEVVGCLAGAERGSRISQGFLNPPCVWVRAAEEAPRGPCRLFERRFRLAEIVERGVGVLEERPRVTPPHPERDLSIRAENASCNGYRFAQQRLGFFAQKAANNVSSLVLRAIPWSPAVHSLFPRGPRAIVRTVLLATARGAVAVPFDVVVSKILPFAITLQRGRTSRSYAAFGGSDDDEHFRDDDGDPDDDGSIANLTAVLSAAAVGGSDDDGSLSSAADDVAAATA